MFKRVISMLSVLLIATSVKTYARDYQEIHEEVYNITLQQRLFERYGLEEAQSIFYELTENALDLSVIIQPLWLSQGERMVVGSVAGATAANAIFWTRTSPGVPAPPNNLANSVGRVSRGTIVEFNHWALSPEGAMWDNVTALNGFYAGQSFYILHQFLLAW